MDAGSEHTKFYLNTGEVKEIIIIGIYLKDSNRIDFKVKSPYRMNESKFVRTYKFVTDEDTFELYTLEGLRLGSFSGLSEYEFIKYPYKYIEENEDLGYIETEFGRIYIHSFDVFYIKNGDVHEFYLITSERTFYDLFSMDDIK